MAVPVISLGGLGEVSDLFFPPGWVFIFRDCCLVVVWSGLGKE